MNDNNTRQKIKYPFTPIPNFIIEARLKKAISSAEYELICLFLMQKPGFNFSRGYMRSIFSPATLIKYVPILIKNNFLLRQEVPITKHRYRVVYRVRPVDDWAYNPKNFAPQMADSGTKRGSVNPADDAYWESIFQDEAPEDQNGIWFTNEPHPPNERFTSEPQPPKKDHNGRTSGQNGAGSERLMVHSFAKERFTSEPSNKTVLTRLPKDENKVGTFQKGTPVDNFLPDRATAKPCPPYKGKGISKTYLTGKVQQIYRFIAKGAAQALITDLLKRFPPAVVNEAVKVGLLNSEQKFFREYRPSHFNSWLTECEKQARALEISKLEAEIPMADILPMFER